MSLIDCRTGKPVESKKINAIYDALFLATSIICSPEQRRLCEFGVQ